MRTTVRTLFTAHARHTPNKLPTNSVTSTRTAGQRQLFWPLRVRSGKGGKTRLVPVHPELHDALSSALAYGDISQGRIVEAHPVTAWRWVKTVVRRAEELGAISPGKRVGSHTQRPALADERHPDQLFF